MKKLKENDTKLLGFCNEQSVNEIAQYLNIKPSSVSSKIKNLEEKGLIVVDKKGWGKKTFVRTKGGNKTKEHFVKILKEIKRKKEITDEEFSYILPVDFSDPKEYDRFSATLSLPFVRPKLIQRYIRLTKEGEKFLKQNSK